jgi:hypothetical protein
MIHSFALILFGGQQSLNVAPHQFLQEQQFVAKIEVAEKRTLMDETAPFTWSRGNQSLTLRVRKINVRESSRSGGLSSPLGYLAYLPQYEGTPSRMPIGAGSVYDHKSKLADIQVYTDYEQVSVRWFCSEPDTDHFDHSLPLVESVARYTLANLAGQRSSPAFTLGVRKDVAFSTDQETKVLLIRVRDWARARGYRYRFNPDTAIVGLAKEGRTILVPLGAKAIKVGSEWLDLPDIVRSVRGEHFVPFAAIEATEG